MHPKQIKPATSSTLYKELLFNKIGYWDFSILNWRSRKKVSENGLRIACIVEDSLYNKLRYTSQVLLLTPSNWRNTLDYGTPHFLLVESFWSTATADWHMGLNPGSPFREQILEIVAYARQKAIPTVFWFTRGREYHLQFQNIPRHFDFVFCADSREVSALSNKGVQADYLPPCVQPALHNPFQEHGYNDVMNLNVLYDGWADLDRLTDELRFLEKVKPYGLSIIESRYQIFRNRSKILPDFRGNILGSVTAGGLAIALKYAKTYLSLSTTLSTKTAQQWKILEAAASRVPVLYLGALEADDPCTGLVTEVPTVEAMLTELERYKQNDLYRKRQGHLAWRLAYSNHTVGHRLNAICNRLGLDSAWVEYPKASIIIQTCRPHNLSRCLEVFENQTYPNKELIIVFNGESVPQWSALGLDGPRDDIRLLNVPSELSAGACLNQGELLDTGEFCFKIDDDDYYGNNYILDMILMNQAIDIAISGDSSKLNSSDEFSHYKPLPVKFRSNFKSFELDTKPEAMKVLFISPRPFGLMGTPGTYHLVSAYASHVNTCVISSDKKDANVSIVYQPPSDLNLHEVPFGVSGYVNRISEIAKQFKPDIVCLANYHSWFEIVEFLKQDLPNAKYVLDIKSPLIAGNNSTRKDSIQTKGAENAQLLDLIVTRCNEDVESWIPNCKRPIFIYPLGVKLSQFFPRIPRVDRVFCSRFVFIGSYSKLRKLNKLIDFIAALPSALLSEIKIDMYGSGPELNNLVAHVSHYGLQHVVRILDQLPQDELLARLAEYDAGLGWVPREIFDAAPSLKVLEYIGSGLVPVISATQAHLRNIEAGYDGILFEENPLSFASAMEQAYQFGFPVESLNSNLKLIGSQDWDVVATKYLLPEFDRLLTGVELKSYTS